MVIFLITALISVTFTIVIITSKQSGWYDSVRKERDALAKLARENINTENQLNEMTDDELRKRALGRW